MEVNRVYLGDNVELSRQLESECVDLTVCSPPYEGIRDYGGHLWDFCALAKELYRVTKQGGVVVWVIGDETKGGTESGESFRQVLYFKELGFNLHDTMIYEKNSSPYPSSDVSVRYTQIFEYMFVLSKGKPKTINLIKDKRNKWYGSRGFGTNSKRGKDGSLIPFERKPVQEFGYRGNIWRYNTGKGYSSSDNIAYEHPAIFPEELARDHIVSWSNVGDLVFDPFAGSGTTLKVAKENNRRFLGFEVYDKYVDIINRRLNISLPFFNF